MKSRILIVDDQINILSVLKEALQYEGFEVQTMEDATEIFSVIDNFQPHLILIDFILNGINGGEICKQIKGLEKYSQIHVFLMSAYPRLIHSLSFYNSDRLIEKPFDLFQLTDIISETLQFEDKDC